MLYYLRNKSLIHLLISFFAIIILYSKANATSLELSQHFSISEGLSSVGVTSLLEDSKHIIWIGTFNGLNRYDGYEFKIYNNTYKKKNLASIRVRTLAEDSKQNLWIGTDEGITIYHYQKDIFQTLDLSKITRSENNGPIIRKIVPLSHKIYCATEQEGIIVFNPDYTINHQIIPQDPKNISTPTIYDLTPLNNQFLILSTSTGLFCYDTENNILNQVLPKELKYTLSSTYDNRGRLYTTLVNGFATIQCYKVGNKYLFRLERIDNTKNQFSSIAIDNIGNLWLGDISQGILHIKMNREDLAIEKRTSHYILPHDFLRISSILTTLQSGCWVGSYNQGLLRFPLIPNPICYYNTEKPLPYSIQSNCILNIAAVDDKRAYIVSNGGGIALLNTETKLFEPLPFTKNKNIFNRISSVYVDKKKNLWIGTGGGGVGTYRIRKNSNRWEKISSERVTSFNKLNTNSITEDQYGNLWIGGDNGLYRISLENNEIKLIEDINENSFFSKKKLHSIRSIYADPAQATIWIGTYFKGLFQIDIPSDCTLIKYKIKQYLHTKKSNSLPANFVTSILRTSSGELWIGTEHGGFSHFVNNKKNSFFITYDETAGLSNNIVKGIEEDDEQNLWISTTNGINKFNTKEKTLKRYHKEEGFNITVYENSSLKLPNQTLLFGGIDGLCYFNPKHILPQKGVIGLEFGDFRLFNNIVHVGDTIHGRTILNKKLETQKELKLKYNENVFSIELIALHYSNNKNKLLKYRMLPIDKDWIETSSENRFAHYNGLQPGKYIFEVTVSDENSLVKETKQISIIITPPFWKSIWAILIYCCLCILAIYTVIHFLLKINKLKYKLKIEHLEKERDTEIYEAKLQLFSNISHEFNTPLTLITAPIESLLGQFNSNEKVKEKLKLVAQQSKKMTRLVNQIRDFQRVDKNQLKVNATLVNFNQYINIIKSDFEQLAAISNRRINVEGCDEVIMIYIDESLLENILYNLLSNAFKFTDSGDTITIKYNYSNSQLTLSVVDTGLGIAKEDLPYIFDRFYQSKNNIKAGRGGSGIGLAFTKMLVEMHYGSINVNSTLGNGSCFTIKIPITVPRDVQAHTAIMKSILLKERIEEPFLQKSIEVPIENEEIISPFKESTVYYVEDNCELRQFIEEILGKYYHIVVFENGLACLNALEAEWPDIIISDILMPQMDGFELCFKIKSDIRTSHIPIILLSACISIEEQIHGLEMGADAYITKPFNTKHLITRINSLLLNRKQLRERFLQNFPFDLEKKTSDNNDSIFLNKLFELMEKNLDNTDLDLNNFARELYLNRTHFYQKVKALTNQTPFELLKEYRLKKAAQLLMTGKYSVIEVSDATGFKSRTHFSKLFKEKYNISPKDYGNKRL